MAHHYRTWLLLMCACFVPSSGCSIATGDMLTFFPQRSNLLPETKRVREAAINAGVLPVPRELNRAVTPLYVVEPGDGLFLQPADVDSPVVVPADQTVLPDGTIHLGKYGLLIVAGKTLPEIEASAQAQINSYHKKDMGAMVARLTTPQTKLYYVLGEVETPGAFPLKGYETVLDGILTAGGLNARASHKSIILSRPSPPNGCRTVLPVCYDEIVQLGDTTTNYQLQPGDRIVVTSGSFLENLFARCKKTGCGMSPHIPCLLNGACSHGGCSVVETETQR